MAFDRGSARLHLASAAPETADAGPALVIREQPADEWYKDQGGRKALLSTVVASPVPLKAAVPLTCRLLLESGAAPPDADGLLRIEDLSKADMLALGPERPELTIRFRILKVSRNFDNSRFVLEVRPDYSKATGALGAGERLAPVRTFPILVKSKRRRSQSSSRKAGAGVASKGGAAASAESSSALAASSPSFADRVAPGATVGADTSARDLDARMRRIERNQMDILSMLRALMPSRPAATALAAADDNDDDAFDSVPFDAQAAASAAPPTPPSRMAFRREGTGSSIGSDGSDLTHATASGHHEGAGAAAAPYWNRLPPGALQIGAGYASSSRAMAAAGPPALMGQGGWAPAGRAAMAPGPGTSGVDSLLAAAEADGASAKRLRRGVP